MKKQTATEWLFAHLLPFLPFSDVKEREHFRKCLEEAKAMEREQIVEAFRDGNWLIRMTPEECEQYYNETYGGEEAKQRAANYMRLKGALDDSKGGEQ